MDHDVCIFLWSALESFPTTSPHLPPFFLSFLISHLSFPTPVLTSLTQSQSYCGGNFSFGCFCLHASLVGQSKNLVKGTFFFFFFAFDYRLQRGMNKINVEDGPLENKIKKRNTLICFWNLPVVSSHLLGMWLILCFPSFYMCVFFFPVDGRC